MLSVKRFINCRYFSSVWLDKLVSFHTAQPLRVRRISKNSGTPLNVESETRQINASGPVDFFGIESDAGVIHVKNNAPCVSEKANDVISASDKEHFLKTSFGYLRFDSDNRPSSHGQYEENIIESLFPSAGNVHFETVQGTNPSQKQGLGKLKKLYALTGNRNNVQEASDVLPETEDSQSVKRKRKRRQKKDSSDGIIETRPGRAVLECNHLGFIDKEYFHDGNHHNMSNHGTFLNTVADYEKYFSEQDSATQNGSESKKNHKNGVQEQLAEFPKKFDSEQIPNDKMNYVDSMYFGDFCDVANGNSSRCLNEMQQKEVDSFPQERENEANDAVDFSSDQKTRTDMQADSNFIESLYFGNQTTSSLASCLEDRDKISQNEGAYSVYEAADHDSIPLPSTSEKIVENSGMHSDFTESNQQIEERLSPLKQSHLLNAVESEMTFQDSSKERQQNDDFRTLIRMAEQKLQYLESSIETFEDVQSSNEDRPDTAYSYVLKLRNSELEEHCQQEGHKIMAKEVPDLSHLTRNELVDLLKDHVLFYNENIVILNKPFNLVFHESKTTKQPCLSSVMDDFARRLDASSVHPQLHTVHRLDKETTGCLLLARNETTAQHLKSLFEQRKIVKRYVVLTTRVPDPPEGIIDIPITEGKIENKVRMVLQPDLPSETKYKSHVKNGKKAVTYYKVLSTSKNAAFVEVRPETGLKHQIRVHLGFGLNCPILGDHKYSHLTKLAPQRLSGDILRKLNLRQSKVRHIPMHIHAHTIIIPKFLDNDDLIVSAPLPDHIRLTLRRLKCK